MKKHTTFLFSALAVFFWFIYAQTARAERTDLKLQIAPLQCQLSVIDTGPNQVGHLAPDECAQGAPAASPGEPPAESSTLPPFDILDIPIVFDPQQQQLVFAPPDEQTPEALPEIILNDFADYLNGAGRRLALPVGQVVRFRVEVGSSPESHSVTVKTIGSDYVVLTIASTPFDTTLYIGNINQYDITGDGVNDIEITLHSISNGVANLTFRRLSSSLPSSQATSDSEVKRNASSRWPYALTSTSVIGVLVLYKKGYLPKPGKKRK